MQMHTYTRARVSAYKRNCFVEFILSTRFPKLRSLDGKTSRQQRGSHTSRFRTLPKFRQCWNYEGANTRTIRPDINLSHLEREREARFQSRHIFSFGDAVVARAHANLSPPFIYSRFRVNWTDGKIGQLFFEWEIRMTRSLTAFFAETPYVTAELMQPCGEGFEKMYLEYRWLSLGRAQLVKLIPASAEMNFHH